MKEQIYVGIDLAKGDSKVAVLDSSGEAICKPFNITNSKEGIRKLLSKLSSYKTSQIVCGCILQMKNTPHFSRKVPHFSVKKLLSTNHNFPLPNYRYK